MGGWKNPGAHTFPWAEQVDEVALHVHYDMVDAPRRLILSTLLLQEGPGDFYRCVLLSRQKDDGMNSKLRREKGDGGGMRDGVLIEEKIEAFVHPVGFLAIYIMPRNCNCGKKVL